MAQKAARIVDAGLTDSVRSPVAVVNWLNLT